MQAQCRLGFERRVDAAISVSVLKTKADSQSSEHGVIATDKHSPALKQLQHKGVYCSCVTQMLWSRTASLRATATTALFLACLPPRATR